ncbi:Beta-defensin 1 [Fukomys damarensis]|uniref:Beta-defensin 1 n=2 Tax=Fukomys damarensis TaxID=885580 RepID=A0A091E3W4_FUKDA|nr:Beta-defensin 1 [Fukomys damarensis]
MRLHQLLFALLFLFVVPAPGEGGLINAVQRYFCRVRGGRCAALTCLPRETQIGHCSLKGRKCCRRKK